MTRAPFPRTILVTLCDASTVPVYALDERNVIVYCNPACQQWLQVSGDQVVGRTCQWRADCPMDDRGEWVARQLCPPPDLDRERPSSFSITPPQPTGTVPVRHRAWGIPLRIGDEAQGMMVWVSDTDAAEPPADHTARWFHEQLVDLNRRLRHQYRLEGLAGESPQQRRLRQQVQVACQTQGPVLIVAPTERWGETIARTIHAGAIHTHGELADRQRWLSIDGRLFDADMLRATLDSLRHPTDDTSSTEGTGLVRGTLLLQSVERLSRDAQHVVANYLSDPAPPFRLLATAGSDLIALAATGEFDLAAACALTALVIHVPPLATRMEDVPYLAQQIVEQLNDTTGRRLAGLSPDGVELLLGYPWPGDLDELHQRMGEAFAAAKGPVIRAGDFAVHFREALDRAPPAHLPLEPIDLDSMLRDIETRFLRRAMELAQGNKAQAARLVGMQRAKFLRRWEQLVAEPHDTAPAIDDTIEFEDAP